MRRLRTVVALMVVLCVAVRLVAAEDAAEKKENNFRAFYDQGFRFATKDGSFSLRMNGLLQVRYSYVDYDPMIRFNHEDYSNFFVRRARLYFWGNAGSPRFTYFFHVQLEPNQAINANDLWLEYRFSDLLQLGAGRMKISYGLEFMNSGSALGMVERSVFSGETDIDLGSATQQGPRFPGGGSERFGLSWYAYTGFATGGMTLYRSQGVQLRGHRGSDSTPTFEYQFGVYQSTGAGLIQRHAFADQISDLFNIRILARHDVDTFLVKIGDRAQSGIRWLTLEGAGSGIGPVGNVGLYESRFKAAIVDIPYVSHRAV